MTNLPNLKLTEQEVSNILQRKINYGGESYICVGPNYDTLYKLFRNPILSSPELYEGTYIPDINELVQMSDNKFQKIKRLHQLQLKHSVRPLSTITLNGRLIGYEMTKTPNMYPIWFGILSEEEQVYCLNKVKEILQYFAEHDITYGDIKERNILFDSKTGEIEFCDMDNIRIENHPIDVFDYELEDFIDNGGQEKNADAYMHSLMTLETLELYLDEIYDNPKEFTMKFKKSAIPIIKSMLKPKDYNGEYIVEYIKKRRR